MIKEEQRFISSDILEGMTSISALLNSTEENDRKIEKLLIDRAKRKSRAAEIGFLTAKSHELGFSIEFVAEEEIAAHSIGNTQERQYQRTCYQTIALISYVSEVMLKILHARLQHYVDQELPVVQAGFRKGRGTRDQIANIRWIIKKGNSRNASTSVSLTMLKPLTVWIITNCGQR